MLRNQAIKTILILALIPVIAFGRVTTSKTFGDQKAVKEFARDYGRPFGYERTLPAIAEMESSLGVNMENPKDAGGGSYGIFGITIEWAMQHLPQTDTTEVIEMLMDPIVNAHLAVEKLNHARRWYLIRKGRKATWLETWSSYNGSRAYGLAIQDKIRGYPR